MKLRELVEFAVRVGIGLCLGQLLDVDIEDVGDPPGLAAQVPVIASNLSETALKELESW